jgi:hypothetical protein
MGTKFTDGPWYLTQSEDGAPRYIREEASDAVLAYVEDGGHVDPQFALPEDEQLANGQLMASAPALYAALERCVAKLRRCAESAGNADFAVNAVCAPFETVLAEARGDLVSA